MCIRDRLVRQLQELKEGKTIQCPTYDYTLHTRSSEVVTVEPKKVILLEGILVLADERLRDLMDIKVYVEADADERILRRIIRDVKERGRCLLYTSVHIPEDGRLDIETCLDAFERAENFFQETFEAFVCESWLVSPKLKELLGEDSNIIKFMGLFENYGIVYPFRQAEQRVFGAIREQKEEYPEHTSLQRALKKYVLDGKEPGMGQGLSLIHI